jgi:hypothetical protein
VVVSSVYTVPPALAVVCPCSVSCWVAACVSVTVSVAVVVDEPPQAASPRAKRATAEIRIRRERCMGSL